MYAFLKLLTLAISTGLDVFHVSSTLGRQRPRNHWLIAFTFASFELLMSFAGLLIGQCLQTVTPGWAEAVGAVLLIGVGGYLVLSHHDDAKKALRRPLTQTSIVTVALSLSLDELAVGFALAMAGIPLVPAMWVIAIETVLVTLIGVETGHAVSQQLGKWSEKLGGLALTLLGLWLLIILLIHLHAT